VTTPGLPVAPTLTATNQAAGLKSCLLNWTSNNAAGAVTSWRVQQCAEASGVTTVNCTLPTAVWAANNNPAPAMQTGSTTTTTYPMTVTTTGLLGTRISYRVIGMAGTSAGAPSNVQTCTYK